MFSNHRRYRGEGRRLPPAPSLERTLFWFVLTIPMVLVSKWYADIVWQVAVAVAVWGDVQRFDGQMPWNSQAMQVVSAMVVLSLGAASSAIVAGEMKVQLVRSIRRLAQG